MCVLVYVCGGVGVGDGQEGFPPSSYDERREGERKERKEGVEIQIKVGVG